MQFALVLVLWSHAPPPAPHAPPPAQPHGNAWTPARDAPVCDAREVDGPRCGAPARRSSRDPWFGRDKLLHFAASAVIQGGAHAVLRANGHDYESASRGAALATLTAGVGKELWDRHRGRDASFRDLAWDGIGGVTGAVAMRRLDP